MCIGWTLLAAARFQKYLLGIVVCTLLLQALSVVQIIECWTINKKAVAIVIQFLQFRALLLRAPCRISWVPMLISRTFSYLALPKSAVVKMTQVVTLVPCIFERLRSLLPYNQDHNQQNYDFYTN